MSDLLAKLVSECSKVKNWLIGGAALVLVGTLHKLRFDLAAMVVWLTPGISMGKRLNYWYNILGRVDQDRLRRGLLVSHMLNMGFANLDKAQDDANFNLIAKHVPDRWVEYEFYCTQLYLYLMKDVDLTGKAVLEVGSGRGGGANFLAGSKQPQKYIGMDFSPLHVQMAQMCFTRGNLEYIVGNACSIPLPDSSQDVVLNCESSHCYPDLTKFYSEVFRVLRPGGTFVYCDMYSPDKVPGIKSKLLASGLKMAREEDITDNAAIAIRRYGPGMMDTFNCSYTPFIQRFMRQWAADYDANAKYFETRATVYFFFVLQKPGSS
eukprot:GGOE01040657.1.p1 GENE.GGOE01040657.1~~GGOE01040657.1.p1  ORF type:complete len:334 (-),score=93.05 GGOE01040657.1:319-1281(-)